MKDPLANNDSNVCRQDWYESEWQYNSQIESDLVIHTTTLTSHRELVAHSTDWSALVKTGFGRIVDVPYSGTSRL